MIELYKILTGKYDEDVSNVLRTRDESTTRGHQCKLYNSLVKIASDLKKIATEFFFPLSFRERPKIKYIKSLPKSTHGKDVISYHKKSRIFADFNVTDGMPYTDYLSRGDNKSFFPL